MFSSIFSRSSSSTSSSNGLPTPRSLRRTNNRQLPLDARCRQWQVDGMELDDLIKQVQDDAITEEPLDLIAAAMGVKADYDDLTDSLIGHFVDQARRSGCSWSDIGSAMGVTK